MFDSTKPRFGTPSDGRRANRKPHSQPLPAWRRWLPVAAIVAVAAMSQARTQQPVVAEQVQFAPPPTTLASHLRTVAIPVTQDERPSLEPDDLVDVYALDPFTGSPVLVVDAGRLIDVDDTRIVIAVPASVVADVAAAAASRLFTVVGR